MTVALVLSSVVTDKFLVKASSDVPVHFSGVADHKAVFQGGVDIDGTVVVHAHVDAYVVVAQVEVGAVVKDQVSGPGLGEVCWVADTTEFFCGLVLDPGEFVALVEAEVGILGSRDGDAKGLVGCIGISNAVDATVLGKVKAVPFKGDSFKDGGIVGNFLSPEAEVLVGTLEPVVFQFLICGAGPVDDPSLDTARTVASS